MDFEKAWEKADLVKGRYLKKQGILLHEQAVKVNAEYCIVEIGSYRGRSLTLLAAARRDVISVDPLIIGFNRAINENAVKALTAVVKKHKNVRWVRTPSTKYVHKGKPIGLLHIDGAHHYPHPKNDFLHMEKWMAPEAVIVFHDYNVRHVGVMKSVAKLIEAKKLKQVGATRSLFIGVRP